MTYLGTFRELKAYLKGGGVQNFIDTSLYHFKKTKGRPTRYLKRDRIKLWNALLRRTVIQSHMRKPHTVADHAVKAWSSENKVFL